YLSGRNALGGTQIYGHVPDRWLGKYLERLLWGGYRSLGLQRRLQPRHIDPLLRLYRQSAKVPGGSRSGRQILPRKWIAGSQQQIGSAKGSTEKGRRSLITHHTFV